MADASSTPSTKVNPLLRYLPLVAILILIWPLGDQGVEVFGLDMNAAIVGAVLAVLGTAYGALSARNR